MTNIDGLSPSMQEVFQYTEDTYKDVIATANSITKHYTEDIDGVVKSLRNNVEKLTNEEIRNAILSLSLKSYFLSDLFAFLRSLSLTGSLKISVSTLANLFKTSAHNLPLF